LGREEAGHQRSGLEKLTLGKKRGHKRNDHGGKGGLVRREALLGAEEPPSEKGGRRQGKIL